MNYLLNELAEAMVAKEGRLTVLLATGEEINIYHFPDLAEKHHGYAWCVLYPTDRPDSECDQDWVANPRIAANRVLVYSAQAASRVESWA